MYEIPKRLNQYANRFIIGTLKQDMFGAIFLLTALILFAKLPFSILINSILAFVVILIGLTFIMFKIDEKIAIFIDFRRRSKKVGYYDLDMNKFIEISTIKNKTILLKSGAVLGVIKVNPIDFTILNKAQKQQKIESYKRFLRSLSFPLQIVSRSVEVNLDNWIYNLEQKTKTNTTMLNKQFQSFKKWISQEMEEGKIRNRVFYIIIPYYEVYEKVNSPIIMIKTLFSVLLGRPVKIRRTEGQFKKILKLLSDRVEDALEKLEPTGVESQRLNDNELLSLYSSYFIDSAEVDMDYITPYSFAKND